MCDSLFLSIKFVVDEQPLRPPSAASSPIRGAAGRELRPAGRELRPAGRELRDALWASPTWRPLPGVPYLASPTWRPLHGVPYMTSLH